MSPSEAIYLLPPVAVTVLGFISSVVVAKLVIQHGLRRLQKVEIAKDSERRDLGFWIGTFETILVFVFVFHNEFSALAIIFAAKEFVRKEKILADPGYYLLGTLANLSIAVLLALITKWAVANLYGSL